ncbi:outer membrane protein assembly factor BamE [Anaerobiospirillum thomasii]|uniref:Outer membrane protein assembly factor BamE n=1 Tax=Anaerobiospirillum thomasii TaxID=179995 RepID=A0A2X0VQF1_9GAMM|nr:outer membrane protein assembly factor BamE [Anaerobiospirillum thomasii]SPT69980.1 Small protein A precursor [Anaerobiospirillum thomasii]
MHFKKLALITATAAAMILTTSCAYRADLAQGNFVEQENIDKLRYGMSDEQVRFVLGTPMLVDPFDNTRWYYVHYLREGWSDPQIKNLIVLFNGRTLVDIAGDFKKPAAFNENSTIVNKVDLSDI